MKKGQQRIGKPSPQIFDQVYATVTSINRQATFWQKFLREDIDKWRQNAISSARRHRHCGDVVQQRHVVGRRRSSVLDVSGHSNPEFERLRSGQQTRLSVAAGSSCSNCSRCGNKMADVASSGARINNKRQQTSKKASSNRCGSKGRDFFHV